MEQETSLKTPFGKIRLSEPDSLLLKGSVYNLLAFVLLGGFLISVVLVYYLFHMFITPLIWALLVGTCIFPFKRWLTNYVQGWLNGLNEQKSPLTLGVVLLPFSLLNMFGEWMVQTMLKRLILLIFCMIGILFLYSIYNFGIFSYIFSTLSTFYFYASKFLAVFGGSKLSLAVLIGVVIGFVTVVFMSKNLNHKVLVVCSSLIWIFILIHFSSLAGSFGLVVFTSVLLLTFFGSLIEILNIDINNFSSQNLMDIWIYVTYPFKCFIFHNEGTITPNDSDNDLQNLQQTPDSSTDDSVSKEFHNGVRIKKKEIISNVKIGFNRMYSFLSSAKKGVERSNSLDSSRLTKDKNECRVKRIFILLLVSHIIVYSCSNLWLVLLLFLLLPFAIVMKIYKKLEIGDCLQWIAHKLQNKMSKSYGPKFDILFPAPLRGLVQLFLQFDEKIRKILISCVDSLVSVLLIFLLLLAALVLAVFLAFQVHNESLHLIALTTNVLNSTLNSEFYSWLPKSQDLVPLIDSVTQNAYLFGRDWISKKIDQIFDTNSFNKARIEESALELWEKLYQQVILKNGTNSSLFYNNVILNKPLLTRQRSFNSLQKNMANMWELVSSVEVLDFTGITNFVRENLGILSTVLESVWLFLRSNVNLVLSLTKTIVSALFGGGTYILNLFVSSLIFLTALFYLLAFSNEYYLPMTVMRSLSLPGTKDDDDNERTGVNVYDSIEHGISSVFAVTFKMACFYGFYTSLTHTIFSLNIVVLPSITAAILAAVPIVSTYWAAVPGMTELIFINQDYVSAGFLFILHLFPMYAVDPMIYSEIREAGHPYLTGLAIAGGVYWLGLEGAVLGPLVLCSLVIVLDLFRLLLEQNEKPFKSDPFANLSPVTPEPILLRRTLKD